MALFRKRIFFLLIVFSFLLLGCKIQNNEESNIFTVTFCSGYDNRETTTQTFNANDTLTFPTNTFTRENYTFLYWTDYNNDYYEGQQITVTEDLYLYAKWQGNYEILSFDFLAENNSNYLSEDVIGNIKENSYISLTVPYGTDVTSLIPTFTLNDNSVGLVLTLNSVTQISGETPNDFSNNSYYYSLSIPNTDYKITYHVYVTKEEASTIYFCSNDDSATGWMEGLTCSMNSKTKLPKNIFEKKGYTFKNWNSCRDGSGDSYEDEGELKVSSKSLHLYAIWIPNTYTVTFVGNGSTGGSMEDQTFTYDVYQSINKNKFTKQGYSFDKWNTSADGSGIDYYWKYQDLTSEANGKVTLYAIWKESNETSYSVEHYLQNVDCTGYEIQSTDTEEKTGTTGKEVSYNNKKYTGFTYDSSLTEINEVVQSKGTIVAEGTTVVKLFYTRNTVTVSFNLDGGSTTTALDEASSYDGSLSGKYGTTIKIDTPTKTGYTFNGWKCYDLTTITFPASSETYTADWTANIYTVTFDGNGGIDSSTNLSTYEEDYTYAREYTLGNSFEKTGYEFAGWSLTKDGEIDYTENATYTTGAENITMYAQWTPLTYTITYYDEGEMNCFFEYQKFTGTFAKNNQPTTHTYGTATELVSPTKEGYVFNGFHLKWNASDNVITTLGATDFTNNIILYATWSSTNIEVKITKADDISIEESTNGTKVTLTAGEGYDSYSWTVDDSIQSGETSNVFNFETSGLVKGYYNIMVTAVKDDLYYSSLVSVEVLGE